MANFSISIQATPWSILNEGIDNALDFLRENGVDAIHLNSHSYYGGGSGNHKDFHMWAPDHFVEDPAQRWQGMTGGAWIEHDPARFADIGIFHWYENEAPNSREFDAIVEAAHARDMRIHARYLDGWETYRHSIDNWDEVLCVSPEGKKLTIPCFSNPRVREWSHLTLEDIGRHPGIDGVLYGIERGTPLDDILYFGQLPYCFCEHCRAGASERGIDMARVQAGFEKLHAWAMRFREDPAYLPDQDPLEWLHTFYDDYPEAWAFNQMHVDNLLAVESEAAAAYRQGNPGGQFAALMHPTSRWFQGMTHDPEQHVEHCQVLAPRLYEHIHGARLMNDVRGRDQQRFLRCYSESMRWEISWRCYAGPQIPVPTDLDAIVHEGIPPEIPCQRVADLHAQYGHEVELQALIGVDITHPFPERKATPADYTETICRDAVRAGAESIVLCREYHEISGESMRAARRGFEQARA